MIAGATRPSQHVISPIGGIGGGTGPFAAGKGEALQGDERHPRATGARRLGAHVVACNRRVAWALYPPWGYILRDDRNTLFRTRYMLPW